MKVKAWRYCDCGYPENAGVRGPCQGHTPDEWGRANLQKGGDSYGYALWWIATYGEMAECPQKTALMIPTLNAWQAARK